MGSPDMIFNAADVKFDKNKNEIPPKGRRPPPEKPQIAKKMLQEMVPPPARPLKRGVLGAQSPGEKKKRYESTHPCPLLKLELHIAPQASNYERSEAGFSV